jgi:hypothetical protein
MGTLIERVTLNVNSTYIQLNSCFSNTYLYYDIVFDNVTPCIYGSHFISQYSNSSGWITSSTYNTEAWGNDKGSNNASSNTKTYFFISSPNQTGPTNNGLYGTMRVYNPKNAINVPFTALVYTPVAYDSQGCQTYSGGSCILNNGASQLTGIRFFFDQNDQHGNSVYVGSTISVYGME